MVGNKNLTAPTITHICSGSFTVISIRSPDYVPSHSPGKYVYL